MTEDATNGAAMLDHGTGRIVGFATGADGRPALARLSLDGAEVASRLALTPVAALDAPGLSRLAPDPEAPCGFALRLPAGAAGRELSVEAVSGGAVLTLLSETFDDPRALARFQEGSALADSVTIEDLVLQGGVFRGRLRGAGDGPAPRIALIVHGVEAGAATLTADPGGRRGDWRLSVPAPRAALADGAVVIAFAAVDGSILARYPIASGDVLVEELAAETASLRAELDQLKRAFRSALAGGVIQRDERPLIVADALAEVEAMLDMRDRAARARRVTATGADVDDDDDAPWMLEDD